VKIVVVSPHLDDAGFSLSLAIGWWLERGHVVEVINCFTRSEHAPYADIESVHENDRRTYVSGLRLKEDESWRKQLGAGRGRDLRVVNLNLKDAPMRLRCGVEEVCAVATNPEDKSWGKIRKAVEEACASAETALVLPLGLGGHVDHRTVIEALLPLVRESTGEAIGFYEDLPYAARLREGEVEAAVMGVGVELTALFAGAAEDAVKRKRRLVLSYDSQVDDATAEEMLGFSERYGGRERVWGTAAFATAGLGVDA
jgi:LmbE family N-acetylglucosaminyl deacetylase